HERRVSFVVILLRELTKCETHTMPHHLVREGARYSGKDKPPSDMLQNALVPHGDQMRNVLAIRPRCLACPERQITHSPCPLDDFLGRASARRAAPRELLVGDEREEDIDVERGFGHEVRVHSHRLFAAAGADAGQYGGGGDCRHVAALTAMRSLSSVVTRA